MPGGTRHYDFAKELVRRGYDVTIVASSFHYSMFKEMKNYHEKKILLENKDEINFVWIKTPPYHGNNYKRVWNMLIYTFNVLNYLPKLNLPKPDIIIGSSVHLFAAGAAYKLSKKYNIPFIMEVRDLWPQTLIDMGISKWHPFIIFLGRLERFLYSKADKIITTMPYAYEYIERYVSKEKITWISNGVDISKFKYFPKKRTEKLIVTYTGAIGKANNLDILLKVANELKNQRNIFFNIIGDGPEKEKLINYKNTNNLQNVYIKNSLPKNKIIDVLINSDVLFLSLLDTPLYKYGISMNKLFEYMAVGRIVILAGNPRNNPLSEANAGFTVPPNDVNGLKNTILKIYNLSERERNDIGRKLRKHVENNYSIKVLVNKLEDIFKEIIKNKENG